MFLFDLISYPVYMAIYKPWRQQKLANRQRAEIVERTPTSLTVKSLPFSSHLRDELLNHPESIDTVDKIFRLAVRKHGGKKCL